MISQKKSSRSAKARIITSTIITVILVIGVILLVLSKGIAPGSWHIDPDKCVGCNSCATECIKSQSAVRAVIDSSICPGLDRCGAYYRKTSERFGETIANQNCPTGAIKRKKSNGRYVYTIDNSLCIGCGKCIRGCRKCEGAIKMTVKKGLCLNCNDCKIEIACPTGAFKYGKAPSMTKEQ